MIVTIAHTKGGVGKSTISWNLAIALKERGVRLRVGDLDFQQTIHLSNEIRKEKAEHPALDVYALDDELLDTHSEDFILTLYDIGGFDSELNREAMAQSDLIIVPISISTTEVMGFATFAEILNDLGIENKRVKILLNNVHPRASKFDSIKSALDGFQFFETAIRTKKDFKDSISYGRGVTEGYSQSCSDDIKGLAQEVLKCLTS